jgi:peptide/nickel transport system ATP-binding protein
MGTEGTRGPATAREGVTSREDPLLSVRNLKAYFPLHEGTVRAVDGVSFDVYPSRVFGIVGESGCGKSVTMKAILRIIEPPGRIVAGEILLHQETPGRTPEGAPPGAPVDIALLAQNGRRMRSIRGAEIALIPQEPMASFSPVHSVGSQVMEAILLHRDVDKAEARRIAVQLFKDVGIPMPERRMDEYSWQLSGGIRQRAVIATALSCNPRLLIADEPTTAVDVTTQAQVLRLLRRLQEERGSAIVFITHDLGVIAQMADDVTVMYLGLVMEQGPVDSIFHAPLHPYTQALLRSIPSATSRPRESLPTIRGSIPHPIHRPPGCPFHPRCEKRIKGRCDAATPALRTAGESQRVRCFLYGDEEEAP